MTAPRIAVLGLGNLMRADDAAGMLALQAMRADPRLPASIPLIEGGTLGLDLLHPLDGVSHLLALDAIDGGVEPGTLLRFAGERIAALPAAKSVHLLGFADLIAAMRLTGGPPGEIVVLGVQPERIDWGTELTPTVAAALPRLLDAAFAELDAWMRPCRETVTDLPSSLASRSPAIRMKSSAAKESAWYW